MFDMWVLNPFRGCFMLLLTHSSSAFPERVLFSEICIDGKEDICCVGDNKKEPCLVITGVGYPDSRVNILIRNLSKSVGSDSALKRWALLSLASPTRIRPFFISKRNVVFGAFIRTRRR